MNDYKCSDCGETFDTDWSDEEASLEFSQNFQGYDIRGAAIVCDDCYNKYIQPLEKEQEAPK
jgi:DNA-directed RNA polymerase subunit RPC12/RpoP